MQILKSHEIYLDLGTRDDENEFNVIALRIIRYKHDPAIAAKNPGDDDDYGVINLNNLI